MKPFKVILKINDQYIIHDERKPQKVDEWMSLFQSRDEVEEISVYQRNGVAFDLVTREYMRRIGL